MAANEVANLRQKLGIPQEALSEALGLYGFSTISRWETGLRKPNELFGGYSVC